MFVTVADLSDNKQIYRSRLECLQKGFGDVSVNNTGKWIRTHINATAKKKDAMQWMYQDSECGFNKFDYKKFCQR